VTLKVWFVMYACILATEQETDRAKEINKAWIERRLSCWMCREDQYLFSELCSWKDAATLAHLFICTFILSNVREVDSWRQSLIILKTNQNNCVRVFGRRSTNAIQLQWFKETILYHYKIEKKNPLSKSRLTFVGTAILQPKEVCAIRYSASVGDHTFRRVPSNSKLV